MYAVIRSYSGSGTEELFDLLEQRNEEVKTLIGSIEGLVSYSLIRTDEGGVTATVCQDKSGADASTQMAMDWLKENASDLNVSPPVVSEGVVKIHVT